ncbi:lysophosphatidylcholine acyltransferase 1 [Caerostris extrusa]|uniref:Lysophosphatidylcholine acyltransferase 1 n=1 Tax=Caerostris extrusa TaxID=172846 RepID=A0AAV4P7J0_CAEEX|nr:lysophosphatidylcholine acyltransferase 1 [Caerostris extrusa]
MRRSTWPGGFSPGVPVQPVFIRYKNELDTITWSWEGPGALKQLWLTLTQFCINCELEENPRIFADNVQKFVSSWTNTPISDFSLEDARFLKVAKQRHLPPTVALVKLMKLRKAIGRQHIDLSEELDQLQERRNSFTQMQGDVEHLALYLGLERCPEALKDFFRVLSQHKRNSLDVRVYDAGLYLLRTDLKVKEKLKEAFKVFNSDNPTEHLETILYYWKGIQYSKLAYKSDTEELSSN